LPPWLKQRPLAAIMTAALAVTLIGSGWFLMNRREQERRNPPVARNLARPLPSPTQPGPADGTGDQPRAEPSQLSPASPALRSPEKASIRSGDSRNPAAPSFRGGSEPSPQVSPDTASVPAGTQTSTRWPDRSTASLGSRAILASPARGLAAGLLNPELEDPAARLIRQIEMSYMPTIMEPNGLGVALPGTIMVVQKEGLTASPAAQPPISIHGSGLVRAGANAAKVLAIGDKVYLKRDITDDGIVFYVQTCGSCDPSAPDPANVPYDAIVTVRFQRGYLGVTDLAHVRQVVGEALTFADAPSASPASPTAAIAIGQTQDQVRAILGSPQRTASIGQKVIYFYGKPGMQLTFTDGKLTDIQ
jgi:hypothetical protein